MVKKAKRSKRPMVRESNVQARILGRRRPFRERIRNLFLLMTRLFVTAILIVFLGFMIKSFHHFVFRSGYFDLAEINVDGLEQPLENEVLSLAGLRIEDRLNLIKIHTREIKERIAAHPKVRKVRVKKQYPRSIEIVAEERKPLAIVNAEKMYLVDAESVVLECVDIKTAKAHGLPFITGVPQYRIRAGCPIDERALLNSLDFIRTLRKTNHSLYSSLSEVNIGEREELTAYFERGTEIRLGRGNVVDKLPELEAFVEKIGNLARIKYADFRFNRQVVYKPAIR